ncbi:MAG: hypothetical protein ACK5C3_11800 [bacterium]
MNNTTPNGWSPTNTCTNCPGFESSDCCGGNGFQHNGWNTNFQGYAGTPWTRNTPWNGATPWNTFPANNGNPWNNAWNGATPWNTFPAFNGNPWNNAWNGSTPWNTFPAFNGNPWNNAWNNATPWNTCIAPNTTGTQHNNTTTAPNTQPTHNAAPFNGGWHNAPNHGHAGLNTSNTNTPPHASHGTAFGPNSAGWHGVHTNTTGAPTTTTGNGNWFPNANPFGWNDATHSPTTCTNTNDCNGGRGCEQTNEGLPQGMKVRSVA